MIQGVVKKKMCCISQGYSAVGILSFWQIRRRSHWWSLLGRKKKIEKKLNVHIFWNTLYMQKNILDDLFSCSISKRVDFLLKDKVN